MMDSEYSIVVFTMLAAAGTSYISTALCMKIWEDKKQNIQAKK